MVVINFLQEVSSDIVVTKEKRKSNKAKTTNASLNKISYTSYKQLPYTIIRNLLNSRINSFNTFHKLFSYTN